MGNILIVDDDNTLRKGLVELLSISHEITESASAEEALSNIHKKDYDLIITDVKMPGMSGLDLIKRAKNLAPETSFIMITAHASIQEAVQAIHDGADDYIMKPFDLREFEHRVERSLKIRRLKVQDELRKVDQASGIRRIIGESANILLAREFALKVASVPSSVLIFGPTGAGKEVLAKSIHESGIRAGQPFVAINCATLNEQLMESELFGHEKGAFTGAISTKAGKFELATGGTIFLDEIGELSFDIQAKLLRVLQEKEFTRIGGSRVIKCDVRVIGATHRDLKKMTKDGTFREDLLFRLNVLSFTLKPLKERTEDIPVLIDYFWDLLCKELMRSPLMSKQVKLKLEHYSWPGNVRELKNVLERLIVLAPDKSPIDLDLLPPEISGSRPIGETITTDSLIIDLSRNRSLPEIVQEVEDSMVKMAMEKHLGNQAKAALALGIGRATLQYKVKKNTQR